MYKELWYDRHVVERKTNNFPFVMIHGFGGWGDDVLVDKFAPYWGIKKSRDAVVAMRNLGFEVYAPSVGPVTSNWDRACELWAQMTGTRVDYGKAHSEKYHHARYGRTYTKPLFEGWGPEKKVNFIGHSFGGPTARLIVQLLAEGSEEERAVTPEEELSDLFKGGKGDWVHTVNVLACCNGVSLATGVSQNQKVADAICSAVVMFCCAIEDTSLGKFFRVSHFMPDDSELSKNYIQKVKQRYAKAAPAYCANKIDNVLFEMSVKTSHELFEGSHPEDNIYYFSYAGNTTKPKGDGSDKHVMIPGTNIFMGLCANFEGQFLKPEDDITDASWFEGDGMVNLPTGKHPWKEPHVDYTTMDEVKPGIWHVMPIEQKHHMSYMGLGEPTSNYDIFYYEIMRRACNLPVIS